MFHILHKVYMLGWIALSLAALVWLYPRTGISEPLITGFEVWRNTDGTPIKDLGFISGQAVSVTDGTSFTLKAPDRQVYSIGLLGLSAPAVKPDQTKEPSEQAKQSKGRLGELILSNEVQVTLTWLDPQHRGIGIVRAGETNVNAAMIESGLIELRRDHIKGLPMREQYPLIRAQRRAKERVPGNAEAR